MFWVVDNGPSHRGWTATARLTDAFPNAVMVHTPVHASRLNQWNLLLRCPTQTPYPRRFASLDALAEQLTAFEAHYNQAAQPFDWRFNRDDLNRLLDRLAA